MRRTNEDRGVRKRVSEAVYPADILSDGQLGMCTLPTFGAWMKCLLQMWHDDTDRIQGTPESLSRFWGCSCDEAKQVLAELRMHRPCEVLDETECNGVVTLVNRRREREACQKAANAARVREWRAGAKHSEPMNDNGGGESTDVKQDGNGPVTRDGVSSSSSSSSSSLERGIPLSSPALARGGEGRILKVRNILARYDTFRDLTEDNIRAILTNRHPLLDVEKAAEDVIRCARLENRPIAKPAAYAAKVFETYEHRHRGQIEAQESRERARKRDFDDLVDVLSNYPGPAAEEQAKAMARTYGAGLLVVARETVAARRKESEKVQNAY